MPGPRLHWGCKALWAGVVGLSGRRAASGCGGLPARFRGSTGRGLCAAQQPDPSDRPERIGARSRPPQRGSGPGMSANTNERLRRPRRLPVHRREGPSSRSGTPESRPSARRRRAGAQTGSPFGRPDRHGVLPIPTPAPPARRPASSVLQGSPRRSALAPLLARERREDAGREPPAGCGTHPRNSYSSGKGAREMRRFSGLKVACPQRPGNGVFPSRCPFPDRSRKAAVAERSRDTGFFGRTECRP